MKKKLLRLSKRILILTLCTTLLSGSVIQRYKITANATSIVLGGVTYTIGEVMAWLGATVLGITGTAYVASDDYSKLIEIGYEAAKAMDAELDNAQDWLFATMDKDGKAYFYANNYFDAIQSCDIASILETSVDLSNDFAIFATDALWDIIIDLGSEIEAEIVAGEENFVTDALSFYEPSFNPNESLLGPDGKYYYSGSLTCFNSVNNKPVEFVYTINNSIPYSNKVAAYVNSSNNIYFRYLSGSNLNIQNIEFTLSRADSTSTYREVANSLGVSGGNPFSKIAINIPVFASESSCLDYLQNGNTDGLLNMKPKVYQIADWSDSPQHGDVRDVITQNPTLVNDYVSGMSNAFGISADEQVVAGEYPDVIDGSIGAIPFDKPDVITPSYVGGLDVPWAPDLPSVAFPGIADTDLPWSNVWDGTNVGNPDIPSTGGTDTEESDDTVSEEEIRGTDSFGLDTLFGILILLIMILLMLLMIFLACLAFIIMIFRIPATTGFLPEDMIAGLNYIKTLQIPGFGMSVYSFFMSLIYIILIFSVIGILRKNIDKIKFPRKGKW